MSWTLCTSGSAIIKAGSHANDDIVSYSGIYATALDQFSTEAEGRIIGETRRDWVTHYATLTDGIKGILGDVCSSLIAMKMIAYDTTGYLSREADALLNNNDEIYSKGLNILKDFKSNSIQTP